MSALQPGQTVLDQRENALIVRDPTWPVDQYQATLTLHAQYFRGGPGLWTPVAEALVPSDLVGFAVKCDQLRPALHVKLAGTRRWYPRRNVLTEYVELGGPQFWNGAVWAKGTLALPPSPSPNQYLWDQPGFSFLLTVIWERVKLDITLKNSSAARQIRWPVSLTGLTWSNWSLLSQADGTVVGTVQKPTGTDAAGAKVPISTSYAGGFASFTANLSGLAFPVTIDPTFTSQPGSGNDTYIITDGFNDNNNKGTATLLRLGHFTTPQTNRFLAKFDLSSIASNATVSSATLSLWIQSNYGGGAANANIYRVLRLYTVLGATWNTYDGTNAWAVPGCGDTATDRESTSIGVRSMTNADATGTQCTWALAAGKVQDWISGALANDGFILVSDNETGNLLWDFNSSRFSTANQRPEITVVYTVPSGTTQQQLTLLGVGS